MKIRLAILDKDKIYLTRIMAAFSNRYADKVEVCSFTSLDSFCDYIKVAKIDVILASDTFDIEFSLLPQKTAFGYIVENAQIEELQGQRTIAKYQRVDLFYKQILGLYAEMTPTTSFKFGENQGTKVVGFFSPAGGVGSSTLAAAFARYASSRGKKTLYLNLEQLASTDQFFSGEGRADFSDVVYAVKSKKTNLPLKLESAVRNDSHGVFFYKNAPIALDRLELTDEDIRQLMGEFMTDGSYEYLVLDADFSLSDSFLNLYELCSTAVFVSNGTEISNRKLEAAYRALNMMEEQQDRHILDKAVVCYNQFSGQGEKMLDDLEIKIIGSVPQYHNVSTDQMVDAISRLSMFAALID